MKITDIKPIPKYIIKRIEKLDKKIATQNGYNRFYCYLAIWHKELVKVTVAVRNKYKKWYCKQVAVHGIHSTECYVKDFEYCGCMGMGYQVGWYYDGLQKYAKWFENNKWYEAKDKYYDNSAPIVNLEVIDKLPEYKYSAFRLACTNRILQYLRLYEEFPQIEYLIKLGFGKIATSKAILRQVGKDMQFIKWLIKNKIDLTTKYYYISSIIKAYKSNEPLDQVQKLAYSKMQLAHNSGLDDIKAMFTGKELTRFFKYLETQNTDAYSYNDYLKACNYLGLDMNVDKNRYPHNFKRWHDIRIDEFKSAKALADEQERQEMYKQFESVAMKYLKLEDLKKGNYAIFIARSPEDLIREGETLHHCVGKMNYDQKFIREESLIFFIRNKLELDTPFVTLEYSLNSKKILQCYGDNDTQPSDEVLNFANNVWLPYAKRQTNKLNKVE